MVEEYMKNKEVREPKSTWKWKRPNKATLHINREYIYVTDILLQIYVKEGDSVERDDMHAILK
jgi:hypothetical protein